MTPSAPWRFALHVTIGGDTHEKLRHAQALLSHRIPSGDLASVLDLALDALVEKLEKRKCARTDTPRPRRRRASSVPRHIPAHVRRAVWERDAGRCTFVGDNGHRCDARKFLEYDHIEPVARGGQATVSGVRLRCRVHNQLEAERTFGARFMDGKRDAARRARGIREWVTARRSNGAHVSISRTPPTGARTVSSGPAPQPAMRSGVPVARRSAMRRDALVAWLPAMQSDAPAARPPLTPGESAIDGAATAVTGAAGEDHTQDVLACLRTLGVRAEEARRATVLSATIPAATLEARVRAALRFLGPRPRRPM